MKIERFSPLRLIAAAKAALAAALVLSILLLARDTVSLLITGDSVQGETMAGGGAERPRAAHKPLLDYAPILKDNVFGFPAGELAPISDQRRSTDRRDESMIANLRLLGTVAWPGGVGYAIVQGASSGQEVFKAGDYISGAGRLVRVESYAVFVESGGREVRVPIEEVGGKPVAASPIPSRPRKKGGIGNFARRTSENTFVLNKKAIEESLENPGNIMTDARLIPRVVNGVQEGFVLREVKPRGVYRNLGLINGDVLLSVNDFKLSNPEAALQAFTAIKGMDKIKLDIKRAGRKMTLTYTIR